MSGVKTSHSMGGARADRAPSVLQPPIPSYKPLGSGRTAEHSRAATWRVIDVLEVEVAAACGRVRNPRTRTLAGHGLPGRPFPAGRGLLGFCGGLPGSRRPRPIGPGPACWRGLVHGSSKSRNAVGLHHAK
eukprot:scaffold16288_cov154-Isochrysis_galbana.AAC.3